MAPTLGRRRLAIVPPGYLSTLPDMCRMVGAPDGVPGDLIAEPFVRMARGENAVNEKNTSFGLVKHGDGWGAVLATGSATTRVRSARPSWDDPEFLRIRSASVKLLHARLASSGGTGEARAHPFEAEIGGAAWHFCHNGTLYDEPKDGTEAADSERFFRRLSALLEREDPVSAFESAVSTLSDITALNALLLGPGGLWAFCVWTDPRYREYYTLAWAETPYGVVVSSEPLLDVAPKWMPVENGTALWIPARTADAHRARLRLPSDLMPAAA
jgi:predicted glutamine amidotransferase